MIDLRPLVAGRRREGGGAAVTVWEPAVGAPLAEGREADAADVAAAVAAARAAVEGAWGRLDPAERAAVMRRCAEAVEAAAGDLATLQAREMGRPVSRGLEADVPAVAATLRYYAGLAESLRDEVRPTRHADAELVVRRAPAGVVAALLPWNMPLLLCAWVLAPALACGCAVVVKPSEIAPASVLALCERLLAAGLPEGAVAVVPGRGETTGAALVAHPGVDVVAFTGSPGVGRRVAAVAGARGARVTLELGGDNALVVTDDADIRAAAECAALAAFANAGQACSAGARVLVSRAVADRFADRLVEAARALPAGDPLDPGTRLGPLAGAAHRARVLDHVATALAAGARALAGPGPPPGRPGGWYVEPTVLVDVPPDAAVLHEEVFGPVVTVEAVDGDDEAVARANATPFGLVAGVWSGDPARARWFAQRLRAGTVWVNCWHRYDPAAPFGGVGASGFGRAGGPESLARFVDPIAVWTVGA